MAPRRTAFLLAALLLLAGIYAVLAWQRSQDPVAALRALPESELAARVARGRDALACVELAKRCRQAGQIAEAARRLEQAVAWQPRLAEAHRQLGFCLAQLGDHERAVAHLERAAALAPADWEAFYYLGTAYQHSGRYLDGAGAFKKAAALGPRLADPYVRAGECYSAAAYFDAAAVTFRQALAIEPRSPAAHFRLGQACWWNRRLEEARREVGEAVRLQPVNAGYHETLGLIEADLPDTEQNRGAAIAALSRAIEIDPRLGTARYRLGTLYRRLGRWREAVAEWEAAAALQPATPEIRIGLGQGYQHLGRRREAAQQFALFRKLQAVALKEKTLSHFRREAMLRPRDPDACYCLGRFYQEQAHDARKAAEQFRQVLRLAPGHAQARERLARLAKP